MDSFGDLYTLAFKNLSSLFLPIVLGMFATTLFFDEHKNDTMKELLIIPITKAQLYFSKVAVVILMSVGLCLITFLLCVVGGLIAGGGNVKKCAVGKYPKSEKLGSSGQAACCACTHSRYFTGGSPSGLRV